MLLQTDPLEKLQELVNHIIREDPQSLADIRKLAGKIASFEITGPGINVFVQFNDHGVTLMKWINGNPHVMIRARAGTMISMLISRDVNDVKNSPEMEIIGDVLLAQEIQKIFKKINIDWEEEFSRWVGDTAAHKIARIFKRTRRFFQETRKTIELDISEYFHYEKNILPDRDEVEQFVTEVDEIRNDAERIRQRVERLQEKITTNFQHG